MLLTCYRRRHPREVTDLNSKIQAAAEKIQNFIYKNKDKCKRIFMRQQIHVHVFKDDDNDDTLRSDSTA